MRSLSTVLLALILAGCSSPTTETTKAEPKAAPEPQTGRQAIQSTFPTARGWAADAQIFRAKNLNLTGYPSSEGKAIAWEVTYVSPTKGTSRSFNWSAVELGNVHEGVYGGREQSWRQGGREGPIAMTQLGPDTPDLYQTAMKEAKDFLKTPGDKPPMTFQLESNPRFPVASWVVMWGNSSGMAQYAVYLNATTGKLLGKN